MLRPGFIEQHKLCLNIFCVIEIYRCFSDNKDGTDSSELDVIIPANKRKLGKDVDIQELPTGKMLLLLRICLLLPFASIAWGHANVIVVVCISIAKYSFKITKNFSEFYISLQLRTYLIIPCRLFITLRNNGPLKMLNFQILRAENKHYPHVMHVR